MSLKTRAGTGGGGKVTNHVGDNCQSIVKKYQLVKVSVTR